MAGRPRKIKPEIQAEEKAEQKAEEHEELEVCAVRSKVTGFEFIRTAKGDMALRGDAGFSLTKEEWAEFMWEIGQAGRQLKI